MTSILDAYYASLAVPAPPTVWTYVPAASGNTIYNTPSAMTINAVPQTGDLMVAFIPHWTTSSLYSYTISDNGSNVWTTVGAPFSGNNRMRLYYKIATSADNNSGAGITVSVSLFGGSGLYAGYFALDTFRPPPGHSVGGFDISNSFWSDTTAGTSITLGASAGSARPADIDQIAWTGLTVNAAPGALTSPNTFTATSPSTNLTIGQTVASNQGYTQWCRGVQASATAATNLWRNAWTNSVDYALFGMTFYHT